MRKIQTLSLVACIAIGFSASSVSAALITTAAPLAPSSIIDFQQFPLVVQTSATLPPIQVGTPVGEDVEMFGLSGTAFSQVGPVNYSLGTNGQWLSSADPNFLSAYLPTSLSIAMEFKFNSGPISGVGAFMNYAPGFSTVVIEAFDSGGVLLESYDLTAVAPINTAINSINDGAFRGIQRSTADIETLRVTGDFVVMDNLTFTRVPEPASALVFALGGLGILTRESRKHS